MQKQLKHWKLCNKGTFIKDVNDQEYDSHHSHAKFKLDLVPKPMSKTKHRLHSSLMYEATNPTAAVNKSNSESPVLQNSHAHIQTLN